jgi:hypothetical protein
MSLLIDLLSILIDRLTIYFTDLLID